jgi:molybdate transport system substrate-binding protein
MKPVALALAVLVGLTSMTQASELQILAGGGITGLFKVLVPQFEAASGHKLVVRFAATPELIRMATSGEPFDLAVVPREVFKDAGARAQFTAGPTIDIARVGFGVAVRSGAPRPPIDTPEAFKQTLLQARSVAFLPQSAAGAIVMRTFDTLGIADAMKAKTRPQPTTGDIPRAVAAGEAELGVFLLNVLAVPEVNIVGPFPAPLQQEFVFTSAIAAKARDKTAAEAFVDFLKSPQAISIMRAQGMTPG